MQLATARFQGKEGGSRVKWVLLALGVAFLLPLPLNIAGRAWFDAGVEAALGFAGVGGFLFLGHNQRERGALLTWLIDHRPDVMAGFASYRGHLLRPETKLRTYRTSVSLLFASFELSSRYVIEGDETGARLQWASIAASLLFGWWAVPFGPIYTVSAVYENLRGGSVVTVGRLLGLDTVQDESWPLNAPQPPRRQPLKVLATILAVPASLLFVALAFLWFGAGSVVSFHNGLPQPVSLELDGKVVGPMPPGSTLTERVRAGAHRLVARGSDSAVVEDGGFTVPKSKDPFMGYTGVYVLGNAARFALVQRCYGSCSDADPRPMPVSVPAKFFEMPALVYAKTPLDEPFPERDVVDGRSTTRTHLCSLSANGTPRCASK